MATGYEPAIIGFLCNWCSYRAADLIGMTRHHHAPNMRPVRVMCSSRVEPELILRAFRQGADGVMVFGCHPGSCHYVDGNIKAMRRIFLLRRVLDQLGIEPARLGLVWTAASEGKVLADAVDRMTAMLRQLGPLGWQGLDMDDEDRHGWSAYPGAAVTGNGKTP